MEASTQVLGSEEAPATPGSAAKLIQEVKAKTRRQFSAEDKIRIVLEGLGNNYILQGERHYFGG